MTQYAWCLGLLTSTYTMIGMNPPLVFMTVCFVRAQLVNHERLQGYDSAMHLSEEIENPETARLGP